MSAPQLNSQQLSAMLKFESDTVSGLGPGTRANILAQRSRSQRFWQENKERRQIRLEQRAAAETYRREEEARRDCRDDPVQRRVAARQQAVAKAKRRLKKHRGRSQQRLKSRSSLA